MRDPKRIERIISLLKQLWEAYPDQRLGQLLINVVCTEMSEDLMFTIEDDVMESYIHMCIKKGF